jgi:hypothetical protein
MIGPPSGVHIWLACGVTDLRNGFDGLAPIVQTKLSEHAYSVNCLRFAVDAEIGSSCCGGMGMVCVFSRSGWRTAASCGRKQAAALCI